MTITRCSDKRCKICISYLQTDSTFTLASGKVWNVKCKMTCNSKNVIYFLKCNQCDGNVSYIGKTNNLRLRTNQHISTCRTGRGSDIFDQHVHNCTDNLSEPYFKLFLLLSLNNEQSLIPYETHFHSLGYDTMNAP